MSWPGRVGSSRPLDGKLDEAREWLDSPQRGLGGAVPLTLAATDHGAQTISDIIGRIEHGLGA